FQSEKAYSLQVLLGEVLQLPHRVVLSAAATDYVLRLPNGQELRVEDHFFRHLRHNAPYAAAAHLPQRVQHLPDPYLPGETLTLLYGQPLFAPDAAGLRCGVDVFASAFFMLSRWEEAALPQRDRHGRFPAEHSLAWQQGFLHRPVVQEWARLLREMLARLGYPLPYPARPPAVLLSCDVDHPRLWWSAADRWRTLGGSLFRRRQPREAAYWLRTWWRKNRDPYDTFDVLMDWAEQSGQPAHFNFLGERPRSSDCWYPLRHPAVQHTMRRIAERGHAIGFHASYEAFDDAQRFEQELESLRQVSPLPVTTGRQHYLRFAAPGTARMWERAGMDWDSTLGYPEQPGFRCGMAQSFPLFDFEQHRMMNVREKPLLVMDVTLAQYRRWSPQQAAAETARLRRATAQHGGEFVLLWHNSSLHGWGWQGWEAVTHGLLAGADL
ncbi:MAG TPA: polysaccharide deacetylase family protein, partial [Saprospiraceae bacterium]|nr:polysaccharide deacetylase family protein [Saprospiraceae bacterium]